MIKINFNQELFDTHISQIALSISKLVESIDKTNLTDNTIKCLKLLSKRNIIRILKADTNKLKKVILYFERRYPSSIGIIGTKKENWSELYKVLREDIFEKEYDNWGKRSKYGAYKFVTDLDLKTCPYCNRNYTFIVNQDNGKLRPELDHFYPKSLYPFLAMSYYNLIPSCSICNHTKSDTQKDDLLNPYDIDNNSFHFSYTPHNIDFTTVENKKYNFDSFEINISGNESNKELFKLEELYKQHKDIVLELLIKKVYYPQSYINELRDSFKFSEDEIYRYLLCNYQKDEDFHKRPLSKLIKDISEELQLL